MDTQLDEKYMRQAIIAGEKGRCTAAPNPWVGCVIVDKNGEVIGVGYHRKPGTEHAEIRAIQDVQLKYGERTEEILCGATAYVTLEPCSHTGRTGPCMLQLIRYKFARVVVGLTDPDSNVSGRGIFGLREAGIKVDVGILESECSESLKQYLHHRRTGKPWVVYKTGMSLDSKIADMYGKSEWITSEESRHDSQLRWRATSQAILVGSGTAKSDDPRLTVREYPRHVKEELSEFITPPLRCVVGRNVVLGSNLRNRKLGPTVVFTDEFDSEIGTQQTIVGLDSFNQIDLDQVLQNLGDRGVLQLLVEGGPVLGASMLSKNLVNQLVVYQAPIILGEGISAFKIPGDRLELAQTFAWKLTKVTQLESDVCLEYIKKD